MWIYASLKEAQYMISMSYKLWLINFQNPYINNSRLAT